MFLGIFLLAVVEEVEEVNQAYYANLYSVKLLSMKTVKLRRHHGWCWFSVNSSSHLDESTWFLAISGFHAKFRFPFLPTPRFQFSMNTRHKSIDQPQFLTNLLLPRNIMQYFFHPRFPSNNEFYKINPAKSSSSPWTNFPKIDKNISRSIHYTLEWEEVYIFNFPTP